MGVQLSGSGGGRGGRKRGYRPLAEINVTPLVDVMLVLLIVFMVAAPLMSVGVPVDLPRTQAPPMPQNKDPLFVTVAPDGKVFVQETEVGVDNLVALLEAVTNANPEARIIVRGDKSIQYGRMLEVMGTMSAAGYTKVGLAANLPEPRPVR
ncbi:ExbD/TolR family protein [Arenibaculum pallidiluteum]|uniref:ExbD/TolR family protein n=1 Tax=Arenibaculum pallidiluteum TaxID=2812559 RepID=UPI001A95FA87|nr:ExbD/TolR family protein [Arenibaculum pallidiluteum]